MRAGDVVWCEKAGEEWVLAYGNEDSGHDEIAPAGWPLGLVKTADVLLRKAATDEEHLAMLRKCAQMSGSDPRKTVALKVLSKMGVTPTEKEDTDQVARRLLSLFLETRAVRQELQAIHQLLVDYVGRPL